MRRELLSVVLGFLFCAGTMFAQRGGLELHGVPASVTSPGVDGRPRGVAASVTDPAFGHNLTAAHAPRNFAEHHHHRVAPIVALPYYGYYALPYSDYSDYEQPQAQQSASQPQVIVVKEEPSDAQEEDENTRYGEHSFQPTESNQDSDRGHAAEVQPIRPADAATQDEPSTTLVYRDGHKSEVRNYAIVGSNLIDLTKSPVMKKIPLSSLNLDATRQVNEDNGVDFHVP